MQILPTQHEDSLFSSIANVLNEARGKVYRAVNFVMVQAYWEMGHLITDDELRGQRADYGKEVMKNLSVRLTQEFGKGFDESNLRYMRLFYKAFPICDALRHELRCLLPNTHFIFPLKRN